MPNRLAQASSAYLQSAAHQPIDWYEFGKEAFERARELDRPVLLDIGAVWCHWCHVIDRESYDDPEIAQLINEHYIAIKVDRDQRPDIDTRYQQVVSSLSGQGGWPLTGFLTYDGRVIYGGTYFPPQAMKNLLLRIKDVYQEKREEIFQSGELLTDDRVRHAAEHTEPEQALPPLSSNLYEEVLNSVHNAYDSAYGGFGSQPKFPHFSTLELLIAINHRTKGDKDRDILRKTLTEMAHGGMYDQLAGGFHRYSVDRMWHVPHFEKMAYDNAEAIRVYAQAYRFLGDALFKEIAEGSIAWVNAQLSNQEHGGFYASQDADIDLNDDGDHFTWTLAEVKRILTPQEVEVVIPYYDLTAQGDMHERPGRNVLRVKGTLTDAQKELLASAQTKLRAERAKRPIPFIDKTLYLNWNGMLTAAYFEAADLLDLPEVRGFAQKTLNMLIERFYRPTGELFHCEGVEGFLEDYAYFVQAALKGYQSTGEARYLEISKTVLQFLFEHFEDAAKGGFYDTRQTGKSLGLLKFQRKPVEDSPSASANAVLIQVLNQLYLMTGEVLYREKAEQALKTFFNTSGHYGLFISALSLGLFQFLNPPLKVDLIGKSPSLTAEALKLFYPGKTLSYNVYEDLNTPEARLCIGQHCLPPVHDGQTLAGALKLETIAHGA